MPEIGATLREARMRARIDIAEIETATKIRAKYLRALENEEWDLLPGPTFVKTFLRTYAEALGLDAKLLVDEYKIRHERLADSELRPISPRSQAATGRGGRGGGRRSSGSLRMAGGGGRSPRGPITLVLVLLVIGILTVLGLTQDKDRDRVSTETTPTASAPDTTTAPASSGTAPTPAKRKRRFATLRVLPTGDVEVCLRAKGQSRPLIGGVVLRDGEDSRTFRSSSFRIRLGNNDTRLRVNGRTFRPSASSGPLGYLITPTRRVRLASDKLPSCG
jgi:cytoskeleton protein RodZ